VVSLRCFLCCVWVSRVLRKTVGLLGIYMSDVGGRRWEQKSG